MEHQNIILSTYSGKSMRWLLYLAIVYLLVTGSILLGRYIGNEDIPFSSITNVLMGILLLIQYFNASKQERTNFIEFDAEKLIFQTSAAFSQKRIEIAYQNISEIQVHLNEIVISQKDQTSKIPVSTSDYNQRLAFKHQFEELKKQLGV
ncbi:hypothetical protein EP331_12600 [bacterium]|nr:MAG: hypothetical protein EP331_12600 [bacterium]